MGTIGIPVFNDNPTGPFGNEATFEKNSTATPDLLTLLSESKQTSLPPSNFSTRALKVFCPLPPITISIPRLSLNFLNQLRT